jgi:hypothetical protein
MKHTEAIRDSISISNGTPVVAYESMADSANAFLGTYNSATKASQGLRLLGSLFHDLLYCLILDLAGFMTETGA